MDRLFFLTGEEDEAIHVEVVNGFVCSKYCCKGDCTGNTLQ